MNTDAVQKYCNMMAEIKRRTAVIDTLLSGEAHTLYDVTTIESIYLQFRKILELIALSSLVANKDVFSAVYEKFATFWNAKKLVEDIERLNPNFYPRPIIQQPSVQHGVKMDFVNRLDDYLTLKELVKLYEKCGAILHSQNPYGSRIDLGYYKSKTSYWRERIVNLLNAHLVTLVSDPNLYVIQMGAANEHPTYTFFVPKQEKGNA